MRPQNHYRQYEPHELGPDGYPRVWHDFMHGTPGVGSCGTGIKHLVRFGADDRCERCHHPYRRGAQLFSEWSACDVRCTHLGEVRTPHTAPYETWLPAGQLVEDGYEIEARWRILTVHHLDGDKANCRWWNLVALCQRCHLEIQGRVKMAQLYPFEHSAWFKPYAAGYYASVYLGEELTRAEAVRRMDELLALERSA